MKAPPDVGFTVVGHLKTDVDTQADVLDDSVEATDVNTPPHNEYCTSVIKEASSDSTPHVGESLESLGLDGDEA